MQEVKNFLGSIHPFNMLSQEELENIAAHTDIVYFQEGETIEPEKFFIIIKGAVQKTKDEEIVDVFHEKDGFDAAVLLQKESADFTALEESLLYAIDKETFLQIFHQNKQFQEFFLADIQTKIEKFAQQKALGQFAQIFSARVRDLPLSAVTLIDATTPIKEAVLKLTNILAVKKKSLIGVVTSSDLKKVILQEIPYSKPIERIATFPAVCIDKDEFLFNAFLLMTSHNIKHLLVTEQEKVTASLELTDILSYFSNQTQILAKRIEKASSIEELRDINEQFIKIVEILFEKGVKSRYISKLISELNHKLYLKVYELTFKVPGTLVLLGSEGRGEQLLRTDQDNAFIVADPAKLEEARKKAKEFTEALLLIGFPKCPGNIMLSNPKWCDTYEGMKQKILEWLENPTDENLLDLSIFLDATALENPEPLRKLKELIFETKSDDIAYLARLAKPVLMFDTPLGFFNTLKDKIDLKKGGIFAIVHGIRVLALQYRVTSTNTTLRIKEISDLGIFDRTFATELLESYEVLQSLRLKVALERLRQGKEVTNEIEIKTLNKLEKDLLKDALKITDRFKEFLRFHYKLEYLS